MCTERFACYTVTEIIGASTAEWCIWHSSIPPGSRFVCFRAWERCSPAGLGGLWELKHVKKQMNSFCYEACHWIKSITLTLVPEDSFNQLEPFSHLPVYRYKATAYVTTMIVCQKHTGQSFTSDWCQCTPTESPQSCHSTVSPHSCH